MAVVLLPWTTEPLVGLTLMEKSKVPVGAAIAATCAIAVFQDWKPELIRYSPCTQKVEPDVGVGSVAAPK